jgi:hypothetical protein
MERLRSYPDIGREELIRFFTLTRKDLGFVDNLGHGGGRGPAARLGLAVQPCTLPWLGFVPDDIWSVPQAAVLRLANQLEVFPGVLPLQQRVQQPVIHQLPQRHPGRIPVAPARAGRHRGRHVPSAGLAVNAGLRGHRPLALAREPGPQHLSDLDH